MDLGRLSKWAMAMALPLVVGLAWLDLQREEARALAEFTHEQTTLATALAATLRARLADPGPAGERIFDGMSFANEPLLRALVLDHRRFVELGPTRQSGDLDDPRLAPEVRALFADMARGGSGAATLSRASAASLGLDRRMAVAGFAPAGDGWSVAVVASAKRVRDRAKVGTWRLLAATALCGMLVGFFGFLFARQQATVALQRSLQRAEKLATIGTLAAGVAHEVGTPLGIISGRAEQALSRATDEPTKKALSSILAQVDNVSTTIRQLLDFSRVRPVEAGAVAPAALLETCRGLLEHRFRQAKVSLTVEAPPTLPPARGDAGQLEQVFVNLLMNAVDACQAGGSVRASVREKNNRLRFELRDDGCGISAEDLPQVLDPFFTTKKRGQGTGLGLSIAADIVKNHGGTLDLESAPGQGTTVAVELPRHT